jgi:hypothetical protein
MFDIILSPLFIEAHMEQGKGPSLKIIAVDRKVDEAFMSIENLESSMDVVSSMQKTLFEGSVFIFHWSKRCECVNPCRSHRGMKGCNQKPQ